MTPIEKEEKAAKLNLKRLSDKVKLDFSFHRIKNVGDYLRAIGNSDTEIRDVLDYRADELSLPLTFTQLKERLDDLRISLETHYWLRKNPPVIEYTDEERKLCATGELVEEMVKLVKDTVVEDVTQDKPLEPSSKETCFLFCFQKRAINTLLDGLYERKLRAQLVIATAGYGKTFIGGGFIRRLLDREYHIGKTVSPWPYFWVTKASVVEQTKRVLENSFGIDTISECMVTNYDQLRATLGSLFLEEKTIVESGIPHRTWVWKPIIHPIAFIFDEAQSAKNRDSTQAQIVRAVANIDNPHVHCVFMSATPFTRVSEAEYFVLNSRIDEKLVQ